VVELHPGYLVMKEKGRRDAVSVDYETIYELGWKIKHREEQAEKKRRQLHGSKEL
jgi:hypothetical protein